MLQQLRAEVLAQICLHLRLDDFRNLGLSCKHAYASLGSRECWVCAENTPDLRDVVWGPTAPRGLLELVPRVAEHPGFVGPCTPSAASRTLAFLERISRASCDELGWHVPARDST